MKTRGQRHNQLLGLCLIGLCSVTLAQETSTVVPDPNGHRSSLSSHMNRRVINKVWEERVRALDEGQSPERIEMKNLIDQLNRVRTQAVKAKTQKDVAPPKVATPKTPVETSPDAVDASATSEVEPVTPDLNEPASSGPLQASTLAEIRLIQEANEWVEDPLTLAEMLYAHGYQPEARWFYEQTLRQADPNAPLDRAWVLLQLGNCTKKTEPLSARRYYRQVIEADDESPWVSLARVQLALVELMIEERPQDLLQNSPMSPSAAVTP